MTGKFIFTDSLDCAKELMKLGFNLVSHVENKWWFERKETFKETFSDNGRFVVTDRIII